MAAPGSGEAGPRREGGAAIERRAGAGQSAPQRLAVAAGGVAILDGGGERGGGGGGQVGPRSGPGPAAGPGGDGGVSRLARPRVGVWQPAGRCWGRRWVRLGLGVPTGDTAVGNAGLDPSFSAEPSRALQPAQSPSGGPCPLPVRPASPRGHGGCRFAVA